MVRILFSHREQPFKRILVIVVLLTLNDDFLGSVDKLVPALFGEIFLSQILSTSIKLLPSTILLIPRYAFSDIVL